MAFMEMEGFDELIKSFGALQKSDVIKKAVKAAEQPVLKAVKSEAAKYKDTGDLVSSIQSTDVRRGKDGWHLSVRPTGRDAKGVSNMAKAIFLEYGTSKIQAKRPFISKALRSVRSKVEEIMQKTIESELEKL